MSLSVDLIDALKRSLRAHGVGYRELSARIGLSEAAVKRMFSLRAMSLVRLEQVCDALGIDLVDLASESARERTAMTQLGSEQEAALVADPRLLLALFLSLNRWREADVLEQFDFSHGQWTALLSRLDRLGIIELLPGNRVRPRAARNFRWRTDGPMERHFRRNLLGDYFADAFDGEHDALLLLSGSLGLEGVAILRQRLDELAREFDTLLARDASLPARERVGVSLVLAQKPWLLRLFEPFRRAQSDA